MFVCSKPRARLTHKNYDRLLTHTHARTQLEDGFFLFFVFLLLHPLTAAAAAAGHHPGSSSFASQPEHSGRGRPARIVHGQRSPDFFAPLSLYSMEKASGPTGKFARDRPEFALLLAFCCGCPFSSSLTHSHAVFTLTEEERKKKCCTHARTHTHFFSSNFVPSAKKIPLFPHPAENRNFPNPRSPAEVHSVAATLENRPRNMAVESNRGTENLNRIFDERPTDDEVMFV